MEQVVWFLPAASFPLALLVLLHRALRARSTLPTVVVVALTLAGAGLGIGTWYAEHAFWGVSGLSLVAASEGAVSAILAMLLFAAPLEEGSKLLVLWGVHQAGSLRQRADGVLGAVALGAGFAAAEAVIVLARPSDLGLTLLRVLLGGLAHLFFASLWGAVLGSRSKLHLLSITWFGSMLMHGLFDHIVFGRGSGTLVVLLPLVGTMAVLSWLGLRDVRRGEAWAPQQVAGVAPPSLGELRSLMRRRERPLALRWIFAGAFVTTGVALTLLTLAVVVGHEIGVDFASAGEIDVRSNGPLVLFGVAVLTAFPVAGYLVARASASHSVLEPAMGAALAIGVVVALLSLAAPVAVVFALAVAPVAFVMACFGAWFGISR